MLLDATNVPFLVDPRKVSANRFVGGAVTMNHFEILRVLGKGAFGKVRKLRAGERFIRRKLLKKNFAKPPKLDRF